MVTKKKTAVKTSPAPEKKGLFAKLFSSADKKLAEKSNSCCCGGCCSDKPKVAKKKKK